VLAAGGILLGAAALQSVLITVPGPSSTSPHAVSVDTSSCSISGRLTWTGL